MIGGVEGKIEGVSLEAVDTERVFVEKDIVRNIFWLVFLGDL